MGPKAVPAGSTGKVPAQQLAAPNRTAPHTGTTSCECQVHMLQLRLQLVLLLCQPAYCFDSHSMSTDNHSNSSCCCSGCCPMQRRSMEAATTALPKRRAASVQASAAHLPLIHLA